MKQFVIGIDPGLKTGVCVVDSTVPTILESHELDEHEYALWLDSTLNLCPIDRTIVVVERFIITPQTHKNGQAGWSLEGIGVAKSALRRIYGGTDLLVMSHTNAKTFSTNPKLKALDLWHKGGKGHANDALRHALHYMVSVGWKDSRLLQN